MKILWKFEKFWVIWVSCLDQYRTLKQIQKLWDYKGNALYQRGERFPIWKEMLEKGAIEERGTVKKRGVTGKLLNAKMDWVKEFLDEMTKEIKFKYNNPLPLEMYNCFNDKEGLIKFLDANRKAFFSLENIKILFGDKENLKNYGNSLIFYPLTLILILSLISFMKKEGADESILSLLTQPLIFNPNFYVNFLGYLNAVTKSLKPENVPLNLISKENLFNFFKKYSTLAFSR